MPPVDALRRARFGLAALGFVTAAGTIGYLLLGFAPMNALYQTVTTISTVGFGEIEPMSTRERLFTIILILGGVGTAIYILSGLVEAVVDGELGVLLGRRRMERRIAHWSGHVIICGYGRVGRSIADLVATGGTDVVVVDRDPERLVGLHVATLEGDASDEEVLRSAGIGRARVLVAALTSDADNLFLTVTARAVRPELFIVARARQESSERKLTSAGADRVVNPQRIGGQRMAAFVLQPHVAEFLDVVMHDGSLEFRLEEVRVSGASDLGGRSLRDAHIRDRTGALILAVRDDDGHFTTNPAPETVIRSGDVLIAVGTAGQLEALGDAAAGRRRPSRETS
jgi:voltage-gated potassium channel